MRGHGDPRPGLQGHGTAAATNRSDSCYLGAMNGSMHILPFHVTDCVHVYGSTLRGGGVEQDGQRLVEGQALAKALCGIDLAYFSGGMAHRSGMTGYEMELNACYCPFGFPLFLSAGCRNRSYHQPAGSSDEASRSLTPDIRCEGMECWAAIKSRVGWGGGGAPNCLERGASYGWQEDHRWVPILDIAAGAECE